MAQYELQSETPFRPFWQEHLPFMWPIYSNGQESSGAVEISHVFSQPLHRHVKYVSHVGHTYTHYAGDLSIRLFSEESHCHDFHVTFCQGVQGGKAVVGHLYAVDIRYLMRDVQSGKVFLIAFIRLLADLCRPHDIQCCRPGSSEKAMTSFVVRVQTRRANNVVSV